MDWTPSAEGVKIPFSQFLTEGCASVEKHLLVIAVYGWEELFQKRASCKAPATQKCLRHRIMPLHLRQEGIGVGGSWRKWDLTLCRAEFQFKFCCLIKDDDNDHPNYELEIVFI